MPKPIEKTSAEKPKGKVPELDPNKVYKVVGTGASKHIKKDSEHSVVGCDAMLLIEMGAVTLKPDA